MVEPFDDGAMNRDLKEKGLRRQLPDDFREALDTMNRDLKEKGLRLIPTENIITDVL